jgi:endoglucanase
LACVCLWAVGLCRCVHAQCDVWPDWDRFKQLYLTADGRVVDASDPRGITVSEGQSYALIFALIANDRPAFDKVLRWTQDNLSRGDLTRWLPAWQWGRTDNGQWSVLDENSASDADLWIAYALMQAGNQWHDARDEALGQAVASRILRDEVAWVPGLGTALLPGPKGFVEHDTWRLNPSYAPIQLLRAIERQTHDALWGQVLQSSQRLTIASAPLGAAADWMDFRLGQGFVADDTTHDIGSYDAIRVYLWTGMLAPSDPAYRPLSRQFAPWLALLAQRPGPPETIDAGSLATRGEAHHGFYAAMLPLLARTESHELLQRYRRRVDTDALRDDHHYYNDALSLFGSGFADGRYRFERNGDLRMSWSKPCVAP